jgi:hypothetical protein
MWWRVRLVRELGQNLYSIVVGLSEKKEPHCVIALPRVPLRRCSFLGDSFASTLIIFILHCGKRGAVLDVKATRKRSRGGRDEERWRRERRPTGGAGLEWRAAALGMSQICWCQTQKSVWATQSDPHSLRLSSTETLNPKMGCKTSL